MMALNENSEARLAYGQELKEKMPAAFPAGVDIDVRGEDLGLHFSTAWGQGDDHRNLQVWISRVALDDYLMPERSRADAEARLFALIRQTIPTLKATTEPQELRVNSEDVQVP